MRKKWLALALSMAMVVGSITGCGGSDSNKDASNSSKSNDSAKVETVADGGGKVLNIYVWNTEFKDRFEKYYPDYNKDTQSIGDVKVKFERRWCLSEETGCCFEKTGQRKCR